MSKYPRTYHLPYSKGATNDDKISKDVNYLLCKEIDYKSFYVSFFIY